jgi:hypothetical protein
MGLFAFRRLRELEAASNEAASLSIAEPTPKLEMTEPPNDGNSNQRNRRVGKRKLLPDAGSSAGDH